jgi:hypothetical protein
VIELCGDPLPWVPGGIHLGNNISTKMEGMRQDIKIKRAAFIQKNIDLNQEFQVSHRWGVFIQCINMFMIFDLLLHFLVILNVITSNVTSVMEYSSSLF